MTNEYTKWNIYQMEQADFERYNWELSEMLDDCRRGDRELTDFRDAMYQLDALKELREITSSTNVAIRVYHMLDRVGLIHHDDLVDLIRWDKRSIEKTIARYILIAEEL